MSDFKVLEIIDAVTIKVTPTWVMKTGEQIMWGGDRIIISGLNVKRDDNYAKHRLSTLLLDKDIDLFNPIIVDVTNPNDAIVACNVFLEKTDVTYYFPEYKDPKNKDLTPA